ncbi:hypothetical protein GGR57DRAFT_479673 [Xylariaceae sp. FL1272]|nr:hypothetical protein GGR57DRAFT_479673 [Xylariaceae sp. FL1272]
MLRLTTTHTLAYSLYLSQLSLLISVETTSLLASPSCCVFVVVPVLLTHHFARSRWSCEVETETRRKRFAIQAMYKSYNAVEIRVGLAELTLLDTLKILRYSRPV